ncbi:MAG: TrkA family potassium uptake protein [Planctomycetaceae bacterium]|nr:TrkA family potassium uptake protein [Planctomycetaceae bacterium]
MTPQRIAVIGLGRFGMALARRLSIHGAEVIAIDSDDALINEIRDDVALAVRLDSTDEAALRSQDVDTVDVCVVAIGENFEAALLTTVICKKNLRISHVICRAQTRFHAQIFSQIGADEVIQPEQNAGDMLGRRLAHPRVNDYIKLSEGFTIIELIAPARFAGKTVRELDLRSTLGVNLIAIRRIDSSAEKAEPADADASASVKRLISVPRPDDRIQPTDVLVLAGPEESLSQLPQE